MNAPMYMTPEQVRIEQASFISKVYGWMSFALALTGLTAVLIAKTPALTQFFLGNKILFYGLILGQLGLVAWLSLAIQKMSATMATSVFLGYSVLNGITMASIFVIYTASSIASTFFITAGTFAAMSVYGYTTKRDLTSMGNLLMMGLIGVIIASIVNIFMQSSMLYWITTYAGVLIFVGLIAYDTQKIKEMNIIGNEGTDEDRKEAILGALSLYLDFINLFLYFLRIFGNRN
ncbi:MAG: hypothetical protein RIR11_4523 [Bacteroidota bacterium]|jgi:hypothetical protein